MMRERERERERENMYVSIRRAKKMEEKIISKIYFFQYNRRNSD